jgi:SAM-dependent methyltransferase
LKAQEHEQVFWQRSAAEIEEGTRGELDWYDWRAGRLEAHLASVANRRPRDGRVLEIGSGPIGIINSLDWGDRFAIDPLEDFYRQKPSLIKLRKPGSTYLQGTGERLPFPDGSFSLVIIDNVIDHTHAPALVLQEISRVLEASGHLYLSVNVHTRWGAFLHQVLADLHIDQRHPYTFTSQTLRRFLSQHRFTVLAEEIEDYWQVKRESLRSPSVKEKVKALSGLSEFQHHVVCGRTADLPEA